MDSGSVQTSQRCSNCGEDKPATLEFFYAARRRKCGLMGWCKVCFSRLKRGEHVPKVKPTALEIYWRDVVVRAGCWGWKGKKHVFGYGWVRAQDTHMNAHVFSWWIHRGDPCGKFVLHTCDNPECSNPDHLFLGTQLDNMRDKCAKGRQARGVTSGNARATEGEVRALVDLMANGVPPTAAARQLGLSRHIAMDIASGHTWRHIAANRLRQPSLERHGLGPPKLAEG